MVKEFNEDMFEFAGWGIAASRAPIHPSSVERQPRVVLAEA